MKRERPRARRRPWWRGCPLACTCLTLAWRPSRQRPRRTRGPPPRRQQRCAAAAAAQGRCLSSCGVCCWRGGARNHRKKARRLIWFSRAKLVGACAQVVEATALAPYPQLIRSFMLSQGFAEPTPVQVRGGGGSSGTRAAPAAAPQPCAGRPQRLRGTLLSARRVPRLASLTVVAWCAPAPPGGLLARGLLRQGRAGRGGAGQRQDAGLPAASRRAAAGALRGTWRDRAVAARDTRTHEVLHGDDEESLSALPRSFGDDTLNTMVEFLRLSSPQIMHLSPHPSPTAPSTLAMAQHSRPRATRSPPQAGTHAGPRAHERRSWGTAPPRSRARRRC